MFTIKNSLFFASHSFNQFSFHLDFFFLFILWCFSFCFFIHPFFALIAVIVRMYKCWCISKIGKQGRTSKLPSVGFNSFNHSTSVYAHVGVCVYVCMLFLFHYTLLVHSKPYALRIANEILEKEIPESCGVWLCRILHCALWCDAMHEG